MQKKPISADSHITEPPNCYTDHIDPKYRDVAPRLVHDEKYGDTFQIDGMKRPVPMGLIAAAGKDPSTLRMGGAMFEDLHRSGWDPKLRLADQDRDGIAAEIIYPTVGMVLCNHPDIDYKKACMDAYNRWLQTYCEHDPSRIIGLGQAAMRTPAEGVDELRQIKDMGFKGVMMPGRPQEEDYDSPIYDQVWEAAVALDFPISFHILTSGEDAISNTRGPKITAYYK